MSDLDKNNVDHVKKHDHSVLGKHTKKDKEKYLEGLMVDKDSTNKENYKEKKSCLNEKNKEDHVKKDDHSFLGKHTKEEKQKYLEGLKKSDPEKKLKDKTKDEHIKKDDHSFLGKHTPQDKQKYLEGLVDKKREPLYDTPKALEPALEPALKPKTVTKRKKRRRSSLF